MNRFRSILWVLGLMLGSLLPSRSSGAAWTETKIPGFVVCSDLSETETARRLAQLMLVIDDFGRVWPTPPAQINPGLIVFCSHPVQYIPDRIAAQRNLFLRTDLIHVFFNTGFLPEESNHRYYFKYGPMMDVWGDHALQRVYSAYFQTLMGERERPWLIQGLAKLMQGMICETDDILLPGLAIGGAPRISNPPGNSSAAPIAEQVVSLQELFETEKAPAIEVMRFPIGHNGHYIVGPGNRGFWKSLPSSYYLDEAYQVVRYGLFGDRGRHRSGFIKFALASSNGPPDEANFRGELGMDEGTFLQAALSDPTVAKECRFVLPPRSRPAPQIAPFQPMGSERVTSMLKLYTSATRPKFGMGDFTHAVERVVDSEDMFFTAFELY